MSRGGERATAIALPAFVGIKNRKRSVPGLKLGEWRKGGQTHTRELYWLRPKLPDIKATKETTAPERKGKGTEDERGGEV